MPLWGVADSNAGEPKNLAEGEFQGTAGMFIYGVDTTEQSVATTGSSQYAPSHAGYVGITTYMDMHGNLRVKTETIVSCSSITGDASDDTILPDS